MRGGWKLLLVACVACVTPPVPGPVDCEGRASCSEPCVTDADCARPAFCFEGYCALGAAGAPCSSDAECDSGRCDASTCAGPAGTRCTNDEGCDPGHSCWRRYGYVHSPECMPDCDYPRDHLCDDGSVCISSTDGFSACYRGGVGVLGATCFFTADCASGLVCVNRECHRACTSDSDCSRGIPCQRLFIDREREHHGYCPFRSEL